MSSLGVSQSQEITQLGTPFPGKNLWTSFLPSKMFVSPSQQLAVLFGILAICHNDPKGVQNFEQKKSQTSLKNLRKPGTKVNEVPGHWPSVVVASKYHCKPGRFSTGTAKQMR